jgi:hypothetical protein
VKAILKSIFELDKDLLQIKQQLFFYLTKYLPVVMLQEAELA